MAELYGSYMLGSVTVAYVSKMLYNYTTNTPVENINENIEEFEDIEDIEGIKHYGGSYSCPKY